MNVKKSLMVAGAVATIGAAGVFGLGVASAATNHNGSDSLIDKIATKFNVNKSEVEAVFEEHRAEHESERQQKVEERLDGLVSEGKLTEDQKNLILDKHTELKAQMESERETLKDMTKEERRSFMQQHHEELQNWAEENDIPIEHLQFGVGFHHRGHMMHKEALPEHPAEN